MWPTPTARGESFAAIAFEPALAVAVLRLWSGDEGGQAVDAAIIRTRGLRLLLIVRLVALLAVMLARLMLIAGLVGLLMVARLMLALIVVTRPKWLLLIGGEARLLAEAGKTLVLFAFLRARLCVGPRLLLLRLILPELLLRRRNQAKIMFSVLIVILRRNRIAGRARVARQLHIFFGDMGCGTADLDVRSVGFEHPGHWILTTPVVVVVATAPVAHPLVLTVSHVVPLIPALNLN
jgi:hypothetical protein